MEATRFEPPRSGTPHSDGGGLVATTLGKALSRIGLSDQEINFIVNSDHRVANLKIFEDRRGNLQGSPEDCKVLMGIILNRLQPKHACKFFLACPFAAQKQIVAQPWFLKLEEPDTVDEKNDFSRQLALLVLDAENLGEEVPIEMVDGTAYPDWAKNGFKDFYDAFPSERNYQPPPDLLYHEPQVVNFPLLKEESSEESSSSSLPVVPKQPAHVQAPGSSVSKKNESSAPKLPVSQELKHAIDSAFDQENGLDPDGELKKAKAAFKVLSAGSPVNPSTFWFVGKATGYQFSNAKLICKLFAVPHPACLQFLFEAMGSANDKVEEKIKATLKGHNLGSLLLNTVGNMAWDQQESFKSVGSLDIAKKFLGLIDQKNKKEMTRFGRAVELMHFSELEILDIYSVLKDVGDEPTTKCVVM